MNPKFFRSGNCTYPISLITSMDASHVVSEGTVSVTLSGRPEAVILRGDNAIDLIMLVQPNLIEGMRHTYSRRHPYLIHNLIGHPLMQLLEVAGWPRFGVWIHDRTLPKPVAALDMSGLKDAI